MKQRSNSWPNKVLGNPVGLRSAPSRPGRPKSETVEQIADRIGAMSEQQLDDYIERHALQAHADPVRVRNILDAASMEPIRNDPPAGLIKHNAKSAPASGEIEEPADPAEGQISEDSEGGDIRY